MPNNIKHINSGNCPKCELIFNTFKGFHPGLKQWFQELQKKNPETHISAAGRGEKDQNLFYKQHTSNAKWGESSHNYNLALDIFKLSLNNAAEWPKDWFDAVIKTAVENHNHGTVRTFDINWYGAKGSKFYELPHCEVKNYKELVAKKLFSLVE